MISIADDSSLVMQGSGTLREAMKQMDKGAQGILFIVGNNSMLLGVMTDGDIRRGLLAGVQLTDPIDRIYNKSPFVMTLKSFDKAKAKKILEEKRFKAIPIVDDDGTLIAYEPEEESRLSNKRPLGEIGIPAVIMAGGKGTRMAPFTNVLPKPLIPIGDKTILELIIDEFQRFGVNDYYFTINYRGEMIRAYFDCIEHPYAVTYLREQDFNGTAGSLKLLPPDFPPTFIVSNCDIIVKADFADVLNLHRKSGAMLTVISSVQHHRIPYGVINFESGGIVTGLEEKPELSFCINTGVYILERECLDYIPDTGVFHMTHLMEALINDGKRVVTYPVNENEYIDIGQWEEYRKAASQMSMRL